jgi:endonuclease/exonuclease/phosphatase family metal-dependent hydrolase
MGLRIATYNIHRCIGRDGIRDPRRTAGVLQAIDADLFALQEVAYEPQTPGNVLQLLAQAVGARAYAGPTLLEGQGRYGNALLCRLAPRKVQRVDISVPQREPRGVIRLTLDLPHGAITVLATHLGLSRRERRRQFERLGQMLASVSAETIVLMGDLNDWRPWGQFQKALQGFFTPQRASPPTFPSRRPWLALDRILVKPAHALRALKVFNERPAPAASDHLPLVAELEL